jgi:hypothetical protein
MGRLILASAEDVQRKFPSQDLMARPVRLTKIGIRTRDLSRSIMRTPALPGPQRCISLPGAPPLSGIHYDARNGSILEQFPNEVLDKILVQMEPIWLFQLERAVPCIATYLKSPQSNRIWVCINPGPFSKRIVYIANGSSTKSCHPRFSARQSATSRRRSVSGTLVTKHRRVKKRSALEVSCNVGFRPTTETRSRATRAFANKGL